MSVLASHSWSRPTRAAFRRFCGAAAAIALIAVCAAPAHAIYIRSDQPVSGYNTISRKTAFAPTGYLADSEWDFAFSSATLVAPNKVLTAAHVVDENGDLKVDDPAQLKRLVFGLQRNVPFSLTPNVASVAINPAYKGGLAGYDLAVITLKSPITWVTPAKLTSQNVVGKRGAMVGYGFQGTGLRDGLDGTDDKLAAFNMISLLQNNTYLTDFDSPLKNTSTYNPINPLVYEGTTASGDSGSPLFADFSNDVWRVAGVLHGGYNPKNRSAPSKYGDVSVYAALDNPKNIKFLTDQHLSFTSGGTTASSASTGAAGATRAVPVPEPGALAVFPAVLGLLARRRRVRQPV
jgi:V8-like Glu-specific endopeptidase